MSMLLQVYDIGCLSCPQQYDGVYIDDRGIYILVRVRTNNAYVNERQSDT